MSKCWKCDAPATHIPKLVVRAFPGASPAEMFVDLLTCTKHGPKPSELISEATWSRITLDMVSQRKLAPDRKLTVVVLVSRKLDDVRAFYKGLNAGRGMRISTEPVH